MSAHDPRVALVHDYLTQQGGAERVVLAMHGAFPGAPIHTSLFDPAGTFPELSAPGVDVRPGLLDRVPSLRTRHRRAFPLLAPTFSALRTDADVTIASSSGWAHGVRTRGALVVYCYAPARWLYQTDRYLADASAAAQRAFGPVAAGLRRWDRAAMARADRILTSSSVIAGQIRAVYGRDPEIVPPPTTLDPDGPRRRPPGLPVDDRPVVLCVSRLLAYKNVGAVVDAARRLPDLRVVIVGDGPLLERLRATAAPNVTVLGTVDDDELRWLYDAAACLVAVAHEDFGLTPIEANAQGTPIVALRAGGYLDTVEEDLTGLFVDEPEPEAVADGISASLDRRWDAAALRAHAGTYGVARFQERLRELVRELA